MAKEKETDHWQRECAGEQVGGDESVVWSTSRHSFLGRDGGSDVTLLFERAWQ
jgi:hypothetical protein